MNISFCLITLNEAANLRRCLQSCAGLADDIVIVDSGSTDGTQEIAREFGARFEHRWDWRAIGYILLAAMCSMLCRYFWRRAADITRELARPLQHDPVTPPDFSALSDGTQVAKDLEDVR